MSCKLIFKVLYDNFLGSLRPTSQTPSSISQSATPPPAGPTFPPAAVAPSYPYLTPQIPLQPRDQPQNSLKSGPQVLIKNVNGSVVITPIPSTSDPSPVNGSASKPTKPDVAAAEKRSVSGRASVGENLDEISELKKFLECNFLPQNCRRMWPFVPR